MSDILVCRAARADDLLALLALYAELSPDNPPLDVPMAEARLAQMLAMPQLHLGIGEIGGRVVTTATLLLVPNLTRGARPFGLIENVVTLAAYRGQGHARRLLANLVDQARDANVYKVMLMTGRKGESVLGFYESCGFARGTKTAFEIRF
ncbi:MAG: GNAT family N-acetyltransferase [Proteobacteria bacterium]|nr:GNAT family N-acetyltransferase [Pseudomonadota bacterium]